MLKWLMRAREDREVTKDVLFGPPYLSNMQELSELLQSDYTNKRIKPGHVPGS